MTTILAILLLVSVAACLWLARTLSTLRRQFGQLRRSFETLVDKAPVGVVQTDAAGTNVFSNDTWSEISGLAADETAAGWLEIVHPDDRANVVARWEQALRDNKPYHNELRLVRRDGVERSIVTSIHPMLDDQGRSGGFIGVVLDVTELRDIHRKARNQDALLRDFIEHSSAAICLKDAEGRHLLANKRYEDLCLTEQNLRPADTLSDRLSEDIARSREETDQRVWKTGETLIFEERIPCGDNARTFLSVKFLVRDDEGNAFAVGRISTDISELDETRRKLAAREHVLRSLIDLQENERQLICHEFHDGLIQYVVGATMLLERMRDDAGVPEPLVATLDSVISCLTKGLEDARRVIRGIRPASLDDLGLKAAIDDLVGELDQDGIATEVVIVGSLDRVDDELHTTVYRVIQELFNNAARHSGSSRVLLRIVVDSSGLDVVVQDFGCGFDPAGPRDGFGLTGLRERVQLAGGTFQLHSSLGEGTRVSIHLPLSLPSMATA
ncbi:MAG: PAS domain-containing sensor histidine kinase [Pirellulales bacterium]